ncbi:hypothetical protein SAMN05421858_3764 [Haladaptatus litoreus]|uniref:Uncharacterized protein n=1 Tax=Haladaptatus litoreus TaxID=553468 RepID=A0A1N7DMR4_9EURY|nr:hypothetical protein SAMN05421858_3764 [Haladaptatus litoreus]
MHERRVLVSSGAGLLVSILLSNLLILSLGTMVILEQLRI